MALTSGAVCDAVGCMQVGMRHFHVLKNRTFTKCVNVDKLWSLAGAEAYEKAKSGAAAGKAPLLDVTKLVSQAGGRDGHEFVGK